ncbi:MAG: ABC-2 family transporter protein [Spirochaetia bacterium]
MFHLRLFFKLFALNLKAQMEYRVDFIVSIFQITLLQLGSLGLVWVVLDRFHALGGWTFGEVAFLVGLRLLSHGLLILFFPDIRGGANEHIVSGEFDKFLLKPVNPLFLLAANSVLLNGFTDFSSGVAIVVISSLTLGLHWTVVKILALIAVILGALLIEMAVYLAASAASFWILKLEALIDIAFQFHEQYILYPLNIYGKPIQILLTFVIPFAFVNFYPSLYFLDKSSAVLFHPALAYATPLVGVLTFAVAYFIWKRGLRVYGSTGS